MTTSLPLTAPKRGLFGSALLRDKVESFASALACFAGVGAFYAMSNEALSDHHWAAVSAMQRAAALHEMDRVREMGALVRSMEREMRRRRML